MYTLGGFHLSRPAFGWSCSAHHRAEPEQGILVTNEVSNNLNNWRDSQNNEDGKKELKYIRNKAYLTQEKNLINKDNLKKKKDFK